MFNIVMTLIMLILLGAIGFLLWKRKQAQSGDGASQEDPEAICQAISNAYLVFPKGDFANVPKQDFDLWNQLGCTSYPDLPCQGLSNVFDARPGDLGGLNSPEIPQRLRDSFTLRNCQTVPYDCQRISDTLGAGLVPNPPWFLAEWGYMEAVVWKNKQCQTKPGGLLGITSDGSIVIRDNLASPWRMLTKSIQGVQFATVTRSFDGELMATTNEAGNKKRLFLNGKTTAAYGNFAQALPDGAAFKKVVAGPSLKVNFIELGENGKIWFSSALSAELAESKLGPASVDEATPVPALAAAKPIKAKFVATTWGKLDGAPTIVAMEANRNIWTRPGDLSQPWKKLPNLAPQRFTDIAFSFTDNMFVGLLKSGKLMSSGNLATWNAVEEASQIGIVGLG